MSRLNKSLVLNLALLAIFAPASSFAVDVNDTVAIVTRLTQEALAAEAAGDLTKRQTLLAEAMKAASADKANHSQVGLIQNGKQWQSYETLVASAQHSKNLEQYLEKRKVAEPTLESQTELAEACRRLGLAGQEQSHWMAVLQLAPDHAEARKRLGFKLFEGIWQQPEQYKAGQEKAKRVAATLRQREAELKGIAQQLKQNQISVDEAAEKLLEHAEGSAIPAWERFVTTPHEAGALAVIKALGQVTDPEASLSLARHALYCGGVQSRLQAVVELKKKDEQSYMPQLIGTLRGPWLASLQARNVNPGELVFRYSIFSDTQDRQQLQTLDQAFFLQGDLSSATLQAMQAERQQNAGLEMARLRLNSAIDANNRQIMTLLAELTGQDKLETPQDWWQWWDDHNEVYSSGDKPLQESYAYRSASVVGVPPQPRTFSSPSSSERTKKDCLAGGTLIFTQRGPVAVDRLRIGDLVVARHPVTGETALKPILQTTSRSPEPLIRITIGESSLRASGGHPFWVSGKGWVRARELKSGMNLHALTSPATISSVESEERSSRTFNIVVADYHSYFVGSEQVFSHDNTVRQPVSNTVPGLTSK